VGKEESMATFTRTRKAGQARAIGNREALLGLMQLSDSFFPSGMYTMSSGLEALLLAGEVTKPRDFERLADSYLRMQVGPADCVALGIALRASDSADLEGVKGIDRRLYSMKLAAETREASTRTGKQLLASVRAFAEGDLLGRYSRAVERGRSPGTHPVALGVVAGALGIGGEESAFILLYTSLVALVGAAVRLAVIDHREAQRVIHSSKATIVEMAKNASKDQGAMRQFFPALEIAQMGHERIENRMFVT
jgi:urease accessory protein